jgi:hypothetical protein
MIRTILNLLLFLHLLVQGDAYAYGYGGTSMWDKMPVMTSDASEPAHRSYNLARNGGYGYMGYDGWGGGYGMNRYSPYMSYG